MPIIDCADGYFSVRLPKDLDEDLLEKIEDYYDRLMVIDGALIEQESSAQDIHAARINIHLKDARYVYASVSLELLNKVTRCITMD